MHHDWKRITRQKNKRYTWVCQNCGDQVHRYGKPSDRLIINKYYEMLAQASQGKYGNTYNHYVGAYLKKLHKDITCAEMIATAIIES